MRSLKKIGLDRFSRFDVYQLQRNKQTEEKYTYRCWICSINFVHDLKIINVFCSAQDLINFDADPNPGCALDKMDPDPINFFKIYKKLCLIIFAYFYGKT